MIVKSKMRYAKKSTPEERRLGKFAYFRNVESSESPEDDPALTSLNMVAHLLMKRWSQWNPAEATWPNNPKKGNEGKKRREKFPKEASQAHTQMCNKAMRVMDRISSLLDKFEDTDSDWLMKSWLKRFVYEEIV